MERDRVRGDGGTPRLLVVSGGSLVGKSTIARALTEQLGSEWVHIEADRFTPVPGTWDPFDHARFARALHHAAFAWLDAGYGVVLDGSLPFPEDQVFRDCLTLCQGRGAVFIGVTTDDATLREHAARRAGADLGWALQQQGVVNEHVPLDLLVDSSVSSTEETVGAIMRRLEL